MSEPVLSLRGVARTYVTDAGELPVLKGVDLDVMPGEIVGLMRRRVRASPRCCMPPACWKSPTAEPCRSSARTARD